MAAEIEWFCGNNPWPKHFSCFFFFIFLEFDRITFGPKSSLEAVVDDVTFYISIHVGYVCGGLMLQSN